MQQRQLIHLGVKKRIRAKEKGGGEDRRKGKEEDARRDVPCSLKSLAHRRGSIDTCY